jgi:hypothetical protein
MYEDEWVFSGQYSRMLQAHGAPLSKIYSSGIILSATECGPEKFTFCDSLSGVL